MNIIINIIKSTNDDRKWINDEEKINTTTEENEMKKVQV